jgi:hypothetical protein
MFDVGLTEKVLPLAAKLLNKALDYAAVNFFGNFHWGQELIPFTISAYSLVWIVTNGQT